MPTEATLPAIHNSAKAVDTKPKFEVPIQVKRHKDNEMRAQMEETRRLIKEEYSKDFKDPLMLRVTQPMKNKVQE